MKASIIPESGCPFKFSVKKIVNYAWIFTVTSTFAFGVALLVILLIALAVDFGVIRPPQSYCHYMTGIHHIDDYCK
jgi:hypothetical protein